MSLLQHIKEHMKEHLIVPVGYLSNDKFETFEVITDNSDELIKFALESGCYISEIRWWDRTHLSTPSPIGYGGPLDPRDPQNYFFAETDICASFNKDSSLGEYSEYLNRIRAEYACYDVYPAFVIFMEYPS